MPQIFMATPFALVISYHHDSPLVLHRHHLEPVTERGRPAPQVEGGRRAHAALPLGDQPLGDADQRIEVVGADAALAANPLHLAD
jgi:hypothetical protein